MYAYRYTPPPEDSSLVSVPPSRVRELETVVGRMIEAGWPHPLAYAYGAKEPKAQAAYWDNVLVGLAMHYLTSTVLKVDTLIALGPCARDRLPLALELADD